MPRYGVNTQQTPETVIDEAVAYFGERGLGLSITSQSIRSVTLEGGGGFVSVAASEAAEKTEVEITTREWDYHVKKFMGEIG